MLQYRRNILVAESSGKVGRIDNSEKMNPMPYSSCQHGSVRGNGVPVADREDQGSKSAHLMRVRRNLHGGLELPGCLTGGTLPHRGQVRHGW